MKSPVQEATSHELALAGGLDACQPDSSWSVATAIPCRRVQRNGHDSFGYAQDRPRAKVTHRRGDWPGRLDA